jgi:hypothetical protein
MAAAAAAEDGQQQAQQQPQQAQHGGSDDEGDDPFADLADGAPGSAPSTRPVVALTDTELHAAQVGAGQL